MTKSAHYSLFQRVGGWCESTESYFEFVASESEGRTHLQVEPSRIAA